jgi:putative PIN family toxin of toxin-antitoxin system
VLDTQVILDWLVFDDPTTRPLVAAIEAGRVAWVAESGALAELRYVLGRSALARYTPDVGRVESALARLCQLLPTPATSLHGLICRDPDDQRFIDLALACGARWLFSRDRAVLALRKRAQAKALTIIQPALWVPPDA